MGSPIISPRDHHAMAIAGGSAVMAALPLLILLPEARVLPPLAVTVLFLIAGLRLGLNRAGIPAASARVFGSLVFPLIGLPALALPPLPAFSILALTLLGQAHGVGRAVERGELPRAFGTSCAIVATIAVATLLAALVAAAT